MILRDLESYRSRLNINVSRLKLKQSFQSLSFQICFDSSSRFVSFVGVPEGCQMVSIPFFKIRSESCIVFRGNCRLINHVQEGF